MMIIIWQWLENEWSLSHIKEPWQSKPVILFDQSFWFGISVLILLTMVHYYKYQELFAVDNARKFHKFKHGYHDV